jgi:hypothetical protein
MKLVLATILLKFKFVKCEQTEVIEIFFDNFFKEIFYLNVIKKENIELDHSGNTKPTKPILVKVSRRQ